MSIFVQQHATTCGFNGSDSWVILSPIEQSIKKKIEAVGTPLKDWNIQIYRGVLTGYNDAFIISTEKREEILANCKSVEERKRTDELIRPILRGRDIKRYGYNWANLWLINTHNGVKGKIPRIVIEDYPAIKAHLDKYWDKISRRADKGDTPYNLRNCAYMEAFNKPVITWQRITRENTFCLTKSGLIILDSMAFISCGNMNILKYLIAILNSNIISFWVNKNVPQYGDKGYRLANQFVEQIPIPPISMNTRIINKITSFVDDIIKDNNESADIDQLYEKIDLSIYSLYNLTTNEIIYIQSQLQKE